METQQSNSPNEQIAQHLAYNHSGIDFFSENGRIFHL